MVLSASGKKRITIAGPEVFSGWAGKAQTVVWCCSMPPNR